MSIGATAWAIRATRISPRAKLVLIACSNHEQENWLDVPYLHAAKVAMASPKQIQAAIRELVRAGYIEKTKGQIRLVTEKG